MVGGVEQPVQTLARELVGRGHAVTVATIGARAEDTLVQDDRGASVFRLPTTLSRVPSLYSEASRPFAPPAPDPELTLHLARLMRRVRPDVVHAHGWIVHSYLPIQAAVGVPLVATLHDYGLVCAKKNLVYRARPAAGRPRQVPRMREPALRAAARTADHRGRIHCQPDRAAFRFDVHRRQHLRRRGEQSRRARLRGHPELPAKGPGHR